MTPNHVTRDEFNAYTQRVDAEAKTMSERLVRVETKIDTMPRVIVAELSKGNIKTWIAPMAVAIASIVMSKYM